MRLIPSSYVSISLAVIGLFLAAVHTRDASAHVYRIWPVHAEMSVVQDSLRVEIEVQSDYWREEVMKLPYQTRLPAKNWPDDLLSRCKPYLSESFSVSYDGALQGFEMIGARYTEEPFRPVSGRIRFTLQYPAISRSSVDVTVRSRFFEEYRQHRLSMPEHTKESTEFITRLSLKGPVALELEIPAESPEVTFRTEVLLEERPFPTRAVAAAGFAILITSAVVGWRRRRAK